MSSALARWLSEQGAKVYVAAERSEAMVWQGCHYIVGNPLWMPIHLDCVWRLKGRPFFDVFLPLESISEDCADQEQGNAPMIRSSA